MQAILDSLGINPGAVFWHAVNFLILLLVLQRLLYRPVLHMLDERTHRIRENLTHAESIRAETERLKNEALQALDNAWREAQDVLTRTQREAEAILAEARKSAREESELLLERTRAEIERDREQAFDELRRQIANLAVLAASRVLDRSLDDAAHRQLVEDFLASGPNGRSADPGGASS